MSNSLSQKEYISQFENLVRSMIKEMLETMMKEELKQVIENEKKELHLHRNGYYTRDLDTRFGQIEDLKVPRDRQNQFQTQFLSPYQRRDAWLEDAIVRMYASGMSTRDVAKFVKALVGHAYSLTTISNITDVAVEEIKKWKERPLQKRYSILYLDGTYIRLRREDVASEVVYFILGIDEEGYREILGFYVGGKESSTGWEEELYDIRARGVEEVLVGVFDGLAGLEEVFKKAFPKADIQRCVVHQVRNTLHKARIRDQGGIAQDMKKIYQAETKEAAENEFEKFKEKWGKKYPREIESWEKNLSHLLTFYEYPKEIRYAIYTTNWIERMNKEFKKRLRPMNSIPNLEAAEKIIYLKIIDYTEQWSSRKMKGFDLARERLQELFEQRYKQE